MSVGYVCSTLIGAGLAAVYVLSRRLSRLDESFALRLLIAFNDCAIFFTFSIQIASMVVLARVDYNISAAFMGDMTVKITWTVSVLTLLPLVYALLLPEIPRNEDKTPHPESTGNRSISGGDRRVLLFSVCWASAVYPFLSRMIESFGDSMIGDGPNDVLSNAEWHTIEAICLAGTDPPSDAKLRLINGTGIMTFLMLSALAISKIVVSGVRRHHVKLIERYAGPAIRFQSVIRAFKSAIVASAPFLSAFLIGSYFELQQFQSRIVYAVGIENSDSQWGFGQVVSVIVFLPVLVEALFGWYEQRKEEFDEQEVADETEVATSESGLPIASSEDRPNSNDNDFYVESHPNTDG